MSPWTGKTALLSTFTLHPPDRVDVVAFFITRRQAGQAVHTTFTTRITEQLAAYCGEDPGRAGQHEYAESVARSVTDPDQQARVLADLAGVLAGAGEHEHVRRLAAKAESVARSVTDPNQQEGALTRLTGVLAEAGQHEHAETIARSITNSGWQAWALADLAGVLAEAGQYEQVRRLAAEAESVARSVTDPDQQARALAELAGVLARAGQHEHAETIARSITDPDQQARALANLAKALAEDGKLRDAASLVASALSLASWKVSAFVIASVDPDAAIRVVAELAPDLPTAVTPQS